jgi:oligosaccharyltransferase complex subunit delta (ribophorin II)
LSPGAPLSKQIKLGPADTLKLLLTTTEDKTAKRPHQAFLTLHEPKTGLEESFVFTVKESGKARVELVCHDSFTIQFIPGN